MFDALEALTATEQILQTVFAVPVDAFLGPKGAVEDSWLVVLDDQFVFAPDYCVLVVNYGVTVVVVHEGYLACQIQN